MNFSRRAKLALGLAAFWEPLVQLVMLQLAAAGVFGLRWQPQHAVAEFDFGALTPVMQPLLGFTMLGSIVLTVLYVYIVLTRLPKDDPKRSGWVVAVLVGGAVGQVLFFLSRVLPSPSPARLDTDSREYEPARHV